MTKLVRAVSDYHIHIFYSEEDKGYIADIPDLEACSAFGETAELALAEARVVMAARSDVAKQLGKVDRARTE